MGIAFFGGSGWDDSGASAATLRRMTDALERRGPDDAGYWVDATAGIALGHRRLAIVDLSPQGTSRWLRPSGR